MAVLAALAMSCSACKKDSEEPPVDEHEHHHGTVRLAFSFGNLGGAYDLSTQLTDAAGHKVKFNSVRFFISGIHLTDDAHATIAAFNSTLLVDASNATNDWELGEIEAQLIHEVALSVGLDSLTNHADPTIAAPPLNDATMHWGWAPAMGYKFVVLEGHVDSNGDGVADATDTAVEYHLATDDLLTEEEIHLDHDLVEGETFTAHAGLDLGGLVAGLDVLAHPTTSTMGDEVFAASLMQAFVAALNE